MKPNGRVRSNIKGGAEFMVLHHAIMIVDDTGASKPAIVLGLAEHWKKIPPGTAQVWVYPITHFEPGPNGEPPKLISMEPT